MKIDKAIHNFVVARKVENCTPRTLAWYHRTLGYFQKWLSEVYNVVEVEDLEIVHLREWISFLQEIPSRSGKVRSDAYVASCARALSSFCHWLEEEEILSKPVTAKFKLPRVEGKFIPTFTPEEVKQLLAACEVDDKRSPKLNRALTARNRAIVALLIDTGVRLKELVGLRLCDVDRDRRLLLVHRKGNWWQQVPVTWDGFRYLHEYLSRHRSYLASMTVGDDGSKVRPLAHKDDPVFLTRDGKPMKWKGVEDLFDKLEKTTGIEGKRVSPHNCRRYMATTQLASGRSPLDVQRQMGHKTLTMTNKYASLSVEQIQESHDLHSPLRHTGSRNAGTGLEGLGTDYWEVE